MRYKLFLLVLLLHGIMQDAAAQKVKRKGVTPVQVSKKETAAQYSINQLNGKWQEIKRTPLGSTTAEDFSDTLLMSFNNNKAELKYATNMSMSMKGNAQIDPPNSLTVAGDTYSILSLDKDKLVINDGEFIKELKKTDQFYYETVGKIKVVKETFVQPVTIDVNNVKGKWMVYSRYAEPGSVSDQTAIIRSLNVLSVYSDGTGTGEVVFYVKDAAESIPCKLNFKDGSMQVISDKYIWNFYTYKADGAEFVFGEVGKLVYYSKH